MNLQICAPYQPCVYHCPFCVARGHKHGYDFDNLYAENPGEYFDRLQDILAASKISTVVITGECDPTQNMKWVREVIDISNRYMVPVELQTHNLSLSAKQLPIGLDVLSYSITTAREYMTSWRMARSKGINRMVMILSDEFDFLTPENFSTMGFDQITFKVLQDTEDERTNRWIEQHRPKDLERFYKIMESRNGSRVSVRVDTDCQTAAGRYWIFRSDGYIYNSWEESKR